MRKPILGIGKYSDEGLTSKTSVSILSFLRCRIYIFITILGMTPYRLAPDTPVEEET